MGCWKVAGSEDNLPARRSIVDVDECLLENSLCLAILKTEVDAMRSREMALAAFIEHLWVEKLKD